jgi:hypothetical protein
MKLSGRQVSFINQVIKEEMELASRARRSREENLQLSSLNEADVDHDSLRGMEGRVNVNVLEKAMTDLVEENIDMFDESIFKMNMKLHRYVVDRLYKETQKYGLGWISLKEVQSILDGSSNDDMQDAEMEFHNSVMHAADEYAKNAARVLMKIVDPANEEWEG